jgi:hypothetical protein
LVQQNVKVRTWKCTGIHKSVPDTIKVHKKSRKLWITQEMINNMS